MGGVILAVVWQGFPFFAVTLLAGLQAIPGELYEAASIDGAGAWGKFRHITLPGLAGVIATALLLRMIWVANSLDLILVMTGGGPGTATQTLPLHAFLTAWSGGNYGQGSALAVLLTLLLLGVVVTYVWRNRAE
jgi:multiple sugar transport system permease protein